MLLPGIEDEVETARALPNASALLSFELHLVGKWRGIAVSIFSIYYPLWSHFWH